jgi:hypothetical protein
MTVHSKIIELVERFDRNLEAYKQGKYNETQVRREFIDPFFEELGWGVSNKKGYAEAYKEVVHDVKSTWNLQVLDFPGEPQITEVGSLSTS